MTLEKPQNSDLDLQVSLEQKQRSEQQKILTDQLQELRSLEKTLHQEGNEKKDQISSSLAALEKKIQNLNLKHRESFDQQVQKIEDQMEQIKLSYKELSALKNSIISVKAHNVVQITSQLPEHNLKANEQRAESIENITKIKPEPWENSVANWAASWIQKLVS